MPPELQEFMGFRIGLPGVRRNIAPAARCGDCGRGPQHVCNEHKGCCVKEDMGSALCLLGQPYGCALVARHITATLARFPRPREFGKV